MSKSLWIGIEADSLKTETEGIGPVVRDSMDRGQVIPVNGLPLQAIAHRSAVLGYGVIVEASAPRQLNSDTYKNITALVREALAAYGMTGTVSLVVQEIDVPAPQTPRAYVH
ncbi:MAG TPA: hypothetical protein VD862_04685 [Candidatus Paceibacterota bacterium]|nr:hypothetical protein [Candidatus Paceibacterota bacterium]